MAAEKTLAFIGCGNMGGAILNGVLDAAFKSSGSEQQSRPISKFIACTKSAGSAERIQAALPEEFKSYVKVVSSKIVESMQEGNVVVLGFKPFMADDVLSMKGVKEALVGKLVISLLAGQTPQNLAQIIENSDSRSMTPPVVVQVIPNMGAEFRQSMTIIRTPETPLLTEMKDTVEWIFNQVGWIKYLPENQMDVGSVLVGAALATLTVPIEGILDGCVAEGIKRPDAMEMVLRGIRGLSAALEAGIHPAVLRESISSPRGCTIQALLSLERAGSRADYADAIIKGTQHLKK
ncbi:uncharacterized protein N7484_010006 [Penicillium longicatenatum]|uniref:uncharacterized protein n=1 Tax=Penicillium longicatenatum TaxID=1561947 RepID=UPI0025495097|nr:uncharacterized protein N7484_010006 [Penicillium longicatenatum]KAJ5636693.1 hypothetical protein N7484_010006 [Penicillium longicatenatum]